MTWNRRQRRLAVAALTIFLIAGATSLLRHEFAPVPAQANPSLSTRPGEHPVANFNAPFVDGISVSFAAAKGLLPFAAHVPALGGQPTTVYVHRDAGRPRGEQSVALVYTSPVYGRFLVQEVPSSMTEQQLVSLAATCGSGCEGSWTTTPLTDGTVALVIASTASDGVLWLHDGVEYDVYGPPDTFSVESATAIANSLISTYR